MKTAEISLCVESF